MREELADLCHKQWSGWMEYLFSKCVPCEVNEKCIIIPAWAVERWKRQIATPYSELSEEEKNQDRQEADRFLKIFEKSNVATIKT
jgi:hypothetical protein